MNTPSVVMTILNLISLVLFIVWGARELYTGIQAMNVVHTPHSPDADPPSLRKYDSATRRKGCLRVGGVPFAIGAFGIVISYLLTSLGAGVAGAIVSGVSLFIVAGKVLSPVIFFIVKAVGGGIFEYSSQKALKKREKKPPLS